MTRPWQLAAGRVSLLRIADRELHASFNCTIRHLKFLSIGNEIERPEYHVVFSATKRTTKT